MRYRYFLFVLLLSIFSCKQKTNFLLSEDKMADVLADLHVSEAAIANTDPTRKDSLSLVYEEQIFTIHHVKKMNFQVCLKQYQKEPVKLEKIYKKVTERLNQRFH